MDKASTLAVYGGLFLTGLASSLHCIGMCGPILVGFSQAFERVALTVGRRGGAKTILWDMWWYHAGRIWTYAALGFVVGLLGQSIRHGSAWLGWQRAAGIGLGALVVFSGVALLGVVPGLKPDRFLDGCAIGRWQTVPWLGSLVGSRGLTGRLLLGVVMGLLPCGLVYAMLAVVAGLPGPWHSAAGMIVFGLGTLPSLTSALWLGRIVPGKLRAHGTSLTAMMVIVAGVWMMVRTVWPHAHCPHEHGTAVSRGSVCVSSACR